MNNWFARPIIDKPFKSEWRIKLEAWQAEQAAKERQMERARKQLREQAAKEAAKQQAKPSIAPKLKRVRKAVVKPAPRSCSQCPKNIRQDNQSGLCANCWDAAYKLRRKAPLLTCSVDGCEQRIYRGSITKKCRKHSQPTYNLRAMQKRRDAKRALGLCRDCTTPTGEDLLCARCRGMMTEAKRKWRARKREELQEAAA